MQYLAAQGVVPGLLGGHVKPKPKPKPDLPVLQAFNSWMQRCRGVKDATLVGYGYAIREVLAEVGDDPITAAAIRRVLLRRSERVSITHAKSAATAIRMFVRFLVVEGKCSPDLIDAIPKIAHWRLENLPRFMPPAALDKLLSQPETSHPRGLRARAVLLLLARLGLRAGDVGGLLVSDVDWERGRLQVCGKSNRQAWLPLCQEVGDALLAYLERGRPKSNDEHLFLTVRKPYRLLSSGAVSGIVRTHMKAAGIPPGGAHVLRHTAATELLRQGMPLEAIGVVLRHQSVETTALYAKVDLEALKSVVQPWPGATAC
jgi:site-specific recombinase XerD